MRGGKKPQLVSRPRPAQYSETRRAQSRQDIDRRTWADLARAGFNLQVTGAGEYLTVDPVMFGKAFEAPPFFTFSVVGSGTGFEEVKAIGWPTDHVPPQFSPVGDWTGLGSQLIREGWLNDGSFEHQGAVWGEPYIPSIGEWEVGYDDFFVGWQPIGVANDTVPPWAGFSNHWIQAGVAAAATPRWVVSNDQAYPNEPGYKGSWSAKYEFDSNPESPWLIPIKPDANPWWVEEDWTDEEVETNTWTLTHDVGYSNFVWPSGGFRPIGLNPAQVKTTMAVHVYSDGPCTLEFYRRDWYDDGPTPPTYSRTLTEYSQDSPVVANAWSEAKFATMIDPRIWPNYPDTLTFADNYAGFASAIFTTLKMRIRGGTPGQKVYIDNVWAWQDLTTIGMPHLTIGVAEWVRDDKGMYLGAYLWFKRGTTAGASSAEAPDHEGQVFLSLQGGDLETATDPYFWADGSILGNSYMPGELWDENGAFHPLTQPFVQGAQSSYLTTPPAPNRWVVSTAAPYDGVQHFAFVEGGTAATNVVLTTSIQIVNGFVGPSEQIYTSRVAEGDSVTFSFRARLAAVTASARTAQLYIIFYDASRTALGTSLTARTSVTLTASYQLLTFTMAAPVKAFSVLLQAVVTRGSNPTATVGSYYLDAFDYLVVPV